VPSATGSDNILTVTTDPTYAGVWLKADFSGLSPQPLQVRFTRGAGVTVRSGDPAWAPGGLAYAYDHEAPLGAASVWTATPIWQDGTVGSDSVSVAVVVDPMDGEVDCWIKPLGNADKALGLQVHTDRIEESYDARVQVVDVLGRGLPAASWDKRRMAAMSITLRTATKAQKGSLLGALDEGPLLVQLNPVYGIDDFYAVPDASTLRYFQGMWSAQRDIPTSFVPIARPATIDAPMRWPGKSYAAVSLPLATYAGRTSAYATYQAVLETPPVASPGGSGFGLGTYGSETYGY
jgi:hypothetical protein